MKWVMVLLLFLSAMSTIDGIGKQRPTITPQIAAWVVFIDMVLITLIIVSSMI